MQKWLHFFPWLRREDNTRHQAADEPADKADAARRPAGQADEARQNAQAGQDSPAQQQPPQTPGSRDAAHRKPIRKRPAGQADEARQNAQAGQDTQTQHQPSAPQQTKSKEPYEPTLHPAQCLPPPMHWQPDPFGEAAPVPDAVLLRRSLALAHMTYTLDIVPWLRAGWRDFSFQIDHVLESGSSRIRTERDAEFLQLANLQRMQRAKTALNTRNPLTNLLSALRQWEESDTVKAVCMMHPLPDGRQLLAIGFMGTGKRFYDWFSNLRMALEDEFHQGFYQLCRRFEEEADSICFPETALALGLERLTLTDVLHELTLPHSRFRLWMAGHSQGGAVMQIYTHRLLQRGVLARHLCGVSFASPTVASARLMQKPWSYPLWHVRNRDDVIARVGAQVHLGRCLDYQPTEAFRRASYQFSALPADEACRAWLMPLVSGIRDNATALLALTGLVLSIAQEKGDDVLNAFASRYNHLPGMDWLLPAAGNKAQGLLRQLAARFSDTYREQTGQQMDEQQLSSLQQTLRPYVSATPLRRILSTLADCLLQPHQLTDYRPDAPGAYSLMLRAKAPLMPMRWEIRCGKPVRRVVPVRSRRRRAGRGRPTRQGMGRR